LTERLEEEEVVHNSQNVDKQKERERELKEAALRSKLVKSKARKTSGDSESQS